MIEFPLRDVCSKGEFSFAFIATTKKNAWLKVMLSQALQDFPAYGNRL